MDEDLLLNTAMSFQRHLTSVVAVLLIVSVSSLIVGSVLGQPILLSYVETGSMSPTIEPDDGFVAVPIQVDDSIEEGDVIVFESRDVQGGGLTTHRVIEETERGYITKGDANPFTDQDDGEPVVKRGQVVAKAMQIEGHVVVIPALGVVVAGTESVLSTVQRYLATLVGSQLFLGARGLVYLFFAMTLTWYVLGELRAGNSKRRQRGTSRANGIDTRLVVGTFAALLVVGATAAMVVPAGTQEYGVVSAEFESERPDVIPTGESERVTYVVNNGGLLPVVSFLEPASDGVEIEPRQIAVPERSTVNASVSLHAPPDAGYYLRYVTEYRYLAVLPRSTIRGLYEVHPWVPIVVIDALIGVPFYLLGVRFTGRARLRRQRSRESSQSMLARVRSLVYGLY